jgi:hypothetical protein
VDGRRLLACESLDLIWHVALSREVVRQLELNFRLLLRGYIHPPASPSECIFAQSTISISAELKQ